jgi:hypothetical protein
VISVSLPFFRAINGWISAGAVGHQMHFGCTSGGRSWAPVDMVEYWWGVAGLHRTRLDRPGAGLLITGSGVRVPPRELSSQRLTLSLSTASHTRVAVLFLSSNYLLTPSFVTTESHQYRLPEAAFAAAFPGLLADGAISKAEAATLAAFWADVQTINRGLENANAAAPVSYALRIAERRRRGDPWSPGQKAYLTVDREG